MGMMHNKVPKIRTGRQIHFVHQKVLVDASPYIPYLIMRY